MLILTDRLREGTLLQRKLGIPSLRVIAIHQATSHAVAQSLIICDVALNNMTSIELLHAALSHYRRGSNVPVLCLTRDTSHITLAQAKATGAAAIIPFHASKQELCSAINELTSSNRRVRYDHDDLGAHVKAGVHSACAVLTELLGAARHKQQLPLGAMTLGADIVLHAIRRTSIKAWLDVVWRCDDLTYQHSLLVAGLSCAFSVKLALSSEGQQLVSQAALVHDIGKASLPYAILNKAGSLSETERSIIRTHPSIGYNMLAEQKDVDPRLLDIVRHHHEYLDGSGYPDGLSESQISEFVRLVTISDIYAALIERRSYKAPMPREQALSTLAEMGNRLDGGLLATFGELIREM